MPDFNGGIGAQHKTNQWRLAQTNCRAPASSETRSMHTAQTYPGMLQNATKEAEGFFASLSKQRVTARLD